MEEFKANNHYVPRFYLREWEDSSNKISVYKTLVSHENEREWKKLSVASIAYQRHLYTQKILGVESDDLERWLDKEYESPAKETIKRAVSDRKLSKDDWHVLIRFVACQDVRTPARLLEHLKRSQSTYQELLQNTVEEVNPKFEKGLVNPNNHQENGSQDENVFPLKITVEPSSDPEMASLKVESYIGRASWIYSIKHVLTHTEKMLHKHKWSIVKPAKGYSWPTSDNPVIKLNYKDDGNYDLGGGWNKPKGNIIFPIGPQHALFVQMGDKPILKGTRLNVMLTKRLKKFIVENAHRVVFSNTFDDDVVSFRPRVVDPQVVKDEKQHLKEWHEQNIKLESEYLQNP